VKPRIPPALVATLASALALALALAIALALISALPGLRPAYTPPAGGVGASIEKITPPAPPLVATLSGAVKIEVEPGEGVTVYDPFNNVRQHEFFPWHIPNLHSYWRRLQVVGVGSPVTVHSTNAYISGRYYYMEAVFSLNDPADAIVSWWADGSGSPAPAEMYYAVFSGLESEVLYRATIRAPYNHDLNTTYAGVPTRVIVSPVPPLKLGCIYIDGWENQAFSLRGEAVLSGGGVVNNSLIFFYSLEEWTTSYVVLRYRFYLNTSLGDVVELRLVARPHPDLGSCLVGDLAEYYVVRVIFSAPMDLDQYFEVDVTYRLMASP